MLLYILNKCTEYIVRRNYGRTWCYLFVLDIYKLCSRVGIDPVQPSPPLAKYLSSVYVPLYSRGTSLQLEVEMKLKTPSSSKLSAECGGDCHPSKNTRNIDLAANRTEEKKYTVCELVRTAASRGCRADAECGRGSKASRIT